MQDKRNISKSEESTESVMIEESDVHFLPVWIPKGKVITIKNGGIATINSDGKKFITTQFTYNDGIDPLKHIPIDIIPTTPKEISLNDCANIRIIDNTVVCSYSNRKCKLIDDEQCDMRIKN